MDQVRGQAFPDHALERRDRADDVLCGDNGARVIGKVDVESGVHHLIGIICRRIFHNGDIIAELGGVSNGCFDASMGYESDHDELMDAMSFKL